MNPKRKVFSLRRRAVIALGLCAVAPAFGQAAASAEFPSRTVTLVSPFAPGGATDILGRLLAQKLGEIWKQTVVVDNKSGAGGVIAATAVARAAPDGHTLLIGTVGPIEVMPSIMKSMPYDPEKDLTGVAMLVNVENVLVVNAKLPVTTMAELIAHAKKNPGKLHFGSSGIATTGHLAGEIFKQQAGIDLVHVPYRGGAPAAQALLAGEVEISFATAPTAITHVKSGRIRALAVTGDKPLDSLPDVKPVREQGLPNFNLPSWYGLLAPGATSPATVARIHADVSKVLAMPDVKARLLEQGWTTVSMPPAQMNKEIRDGIRMWKPVVQRAGIQPE